MSTGSTRFDIGAPRCALGDLGAVHFIAIGGAGMSAVARLMLAAGVAVSGSDAKPGPVLDELAAEGARIFVGHDAGHLAGVDTVVVSSAIREDNVELSSARAQGLRILHRSQGLASVMGERRGVAVAGANGKTTTTSMLAVALVTAGARPSFASGSIVTQLGSNAAWGDGPDFVVEADESDGSFLAYRPFVAIVTNVQPDHLDFYGTFDAVREAYAAFAETVSDDGLLVACWDDPGSRDLALARRAAGSRVLTYGFEAGADARLTERSAVGMGASAAVDLPDATRRDLDLRVPGRHNLLNATAALLAGSAGLGVGVEALLGGLAGFVGASRRFDLRGEVGGVRVVDDYAHNAPKVAALVTTARAVLERAGSGRVIVVFQPHLFSRTRDFADGFAAGLAAADEVVLLDIYGAREDPIEGVTSALIADHLARLAPRTPVTRAASMAEAARLVADRARPADLVLTVGAGDVTLLGPLILQALTDVHPAGSVGSAAHGQPGQPEPREQPA